MTGTTAEERADMAVDEKRISEESTTQDAEPEIPSSGVGAAVGRFLDALATRVRGAAPEAGKADFRILADTIPQLAWVADADESIQNRGMLIGSG